MRRGILIVLLATGAVFGFTLGFGRIYAWQHHGWGHGRHGAWEDRAADVCVRAAERVLNERQSAAPKAPTP